MSGSSRPSKGRWPQEFKDAGIRSYEAANRELERRLIADFNRRFTVEPAQPETAFVPLVGLDLTLLMSVQHDRVVQNDNTVRFQRLVLQLPHGLDRLHYVRCAVVVHELLDGNLAVSFQAKLLARFDPHGRPLCAPLNHEKKSNP